MTEKDITIKLNNVSKKFNVYKKNIERIKGVIFDRKPTEVKNALRNISFNVKKGEHLVIMGVTDSGRSTLMKVISGITLPSGGSVTINGTCNIMLDAKVGMDMEFTCRDNIYLKGNIVGLSKSQIEPHIEEILAFAEAEDFADLPMKRAPKGTHALISLAVHLLMDADIILCDEVFVGGGNYVTTKCERKMTQYLNENPAVTAILVTNRKGYANATRARAIVLDNGKIIFDGNVLDATKLFVEINDKDNEKGERK